MQTFSKVKTLTKTGCFGLLLAAMSAPVLAADLTVTVSTIKEAKGNLMVAVYDSKENFTLRQAVTQQSTKAIEGEMTLVFAGLPQGKYSVMFFQDVNSNGTLDSNLLGIPKEPWGGSIQAGNLFGPPSWKGTCFDLPAEGSTLTLEIR